MLCLNDGSQYDVSSETVCLNIVLSLISHANVVYVEAEKALVRQCEGSGEAVQM